MVSNRILNAGILAEISCDRLIASVRVLFLRLLRVLALTVPTGSAPGVPGQAALHPEDVVGVLSQFTLPITGFQNELSQRYRCQDTALLLIRSKKRSYLLNYIRLRQILQDRCLSPLYSQTATRIRGSLQRLRHILSKISHPCIHPVARTRLISKPSVNRQDHLPALRRIIQCLILIPEPNQLILAVALADIDTELNQLLINDIPECIRLCSIGSTLNRNRPLVIGVTGRAPGTVLLFHIHPDTPVLVNAVVAGCLCATLCKPVTKTFSCTLAHNTMRRDPVDRHCPLSGVVRTQLRISHHRTIGISHYSPPSFFSSTASLPSSSFSLLS